MNHFIDLETAVAMTAQYRQQFNSLLSEQYQNQDVLPVSETFDRSAIDALLQSSDCQQVRIYYGMSPDQKIHAIIVGADSEGRDILPGPNSLMEDEGKIVETSQRCPVICPPESPLYP